LIEGLLASKADVLDAQHEALADCYAKLSPRDQHLIELRYQEGATVKSVAERLQRSVDAVYKALNRIHTALLDCVISATAHRE
jgi:RNA polymerase sigma-70 factor (ECF subfamily)